ncbi:MAG: glycosyltransferase family 2 protein [Acidimicrobiales bacterium]
MIAHVAVVVPAHDEATLLPDALAAIQQACAQLPVSVARTVVVVADGCTDGSERVAIDALRDGIGGIVAVTRRRCVGAARRLGVAQALAVRRAPLARTWIANTDADSIVPPGWLGEQLALAAAGCAAVAGTVRLIDQEGGDGDARAAGAARRAFARTYRANPDGSHDHVHGANLGVRADAYRAVGGWRPLATGEDRQLWRRLADQWPVLTTDRIAVATSARLVGRAPAGFAAALARGGSLERTGERW